MTQDGRLIVIEGIDGAGKTTICNRLTKDYDFRYMSQPEDTWVGRAARKALREDVDPACDLFLHMAAHANQQPRIRKILDENDIVMDRYYHSRVAYQSVASHFTAKQIDDFHTGWSIVPTTTVILDVDPRAAMKRSGDNGDKFEETEFLSQVRQRYIDQYKNADNVGFVDASMPEEQVYGKVLSLLDP